MKVRPCKEGPPLGPPQPGPRAPPSTLGIKPRRLGGPPWLAALIFSSISSCSCFSRSIAWDSLSRRRLSTVRSRWAAWPTSSSLPLGGSSHRPLAAASTCSPSSWSRHDSSSSASAFWSPLISFSRSHISSSSCSPGQSSILWVASSTWRSSCHFLSSSRATWATSHITAPFRRLFPKSP